MLGRIKIAFMPSSATARRVSATALSTSCGDTAAAPNMRFGSAGLRYSRAASRCRRGTRRRRNARPCVSKAVTYIAEVGNRIGEVEPLLVHRPDLRFRVEIARDLLGVAVAERFLLGVADRRPVAARHRRHDLALDQRADVPAPLVEPPRRPVGEFRVDIALPEIDRLHHVHLGVDQLKPFFAMTMPLTRLSALKRPTILAARASPVYAGFTRPRRRLLRRSSRREYRETETSITGKVAHGKFAVSFFLACLAVLEMEGVQLEDL